jgi:hypothetical protein
MSFDIQVTNFYVCTFQETWFLRIPIPFSGVENYLLRVKNRVSGANLIVVLNQYMGDETNTDPLFGGFLSFFS